MSRFRFLMNTKDWLGILAELAIKENVTVFLVRHKTLEHSFQIFFPSHDQLIANDIGNLSFNTLYITSEGKPHSTTDETSLDRLQDELIAFRGGQYNKKFIATTTMQIVSKRTNAKKLFMKIKRQLRKRSTEKGMKTKKGAVYRNIWYDPAILDNELRLDANHSEDSWLLTPLEP